MKKHVVAISSGLLVPVLLVICFLIAHPVQPAKEFSQAELVQMSQSNLIGKVQFIQGPKGGLKNEVRGTYYQTDSAGQILVENGKRVELPFRSRISMDGSLLRVFSTNTDFSIHEQWW